MNIARSLRTLAVALVFCALFSPAIGLADPPTISVEITGLRSARGHVLGALFDRAATWTVQGREVAACRAAPRDGRATCVFLDVPPGRYAVAFVHDEDGNDAMTKDFFGIPVEGYGFSNDPPHGLGPPSFESASFRHEGGATRVAARTQYGL